MNRRELIQVLSLAPIVGMRLQDTTPTIELTPTTTTPPPEKDRETCPTHIEGRKQ